MPSRFRQYFTETDLVMLERILDRAGLANGDDPDDRRKRREGAQFLIGQFQQGVTAEKALGLALKAKPAAQASAPVTSTGYQQAARHYRDSLAPVAGEAGGYSFGRRVEPNGTWTIYHVFSGVPAEFASWKMVGLHVKTAERALKILNTPKKALQP
ncbi:MAG: hypothetical protein JWL86_6288 [Rhizobium sp.]|nr:hypothetical protein [Rhizobium sp.]